MSGDLPCSPGVDIELRTVAEVESGVPLRRRAAHLTLVEARGARQEEPKTLWLQDTWIRLAGVALIPVAGWLVVWSAAYLIGQAAGWLSVWAWP